MASASTRIGDAVAQVLRMRGVTQAQLGREIGKAPATISNWVRGKAPFDHDDVEQIERAVGVPLGTVALLAGFAERNWGTRDVIAVAPELSVESRNSLLYWYDMAVVMDAERAAGHVEDL